MKRFQCPDCVNQLYFDSTKCVDCDKPIGYLPSSSRMLTLARDGEGQLVAFHNSSKFKLCKNAELGACNWLVEAGDTVEFCSSCRHNSMIPDLSIPANLLGWRAVELAKRHLFYSLIKWKLPLPTRAEEPNSGLEFNVLGSITKPDGTTEKVLTGHQDGVITLNIAEADDAIREKMRTNMHEPYRTLLGHFRHEVGHFYWDRLVRDGGALDAFREVFGDETADYEKALERNYKAGPVSDWPEHFISSYASVHPWEDFAETWAHYVHIVDSLETARAYGMTINASKGSPEEAEVDFQPYDATEIGAVIDAWVPFTLALNSINRSMGQRDFYPFVISPGVLDKLAFIQRLIHHSI